MLFLPFFLSKYDTIGQGFGWWILMLWIYQVTGAVVIGIGLGVLLRKLLKKATYENWMDKESFLGLSFAAALMTLGLFSRLGMDELLGCFVVGLTVSWDRWLNDQLDGSHIQEVLDSLLNIAYFVFFGSRIPWSAYGTMEALAPWRIVVACILILLFRRLPIVLALWKWIPGLHSWEEAVFAGWFGPIGAGAIYYATLSIAVMKEPVQPLFGIVCAIVISSVLIHCGSVGLFHIGLVRARTLEQRHNYEQSIVVMQSSSTLDPLPLTRHDSRPRSDCQ
jgi:NhaP-type Na+/H+ or K+/H+ antiporter